MYFWTNLENVFNFQYKRKILKLYFLPQSFGFEKKKNPEIFAYFFFFTKIHIVFAKNKRKCSHFFAKVFFAGNPSHNLKI